MKKLFVVIALSVVCGFASAQSIRDIWINMPDQLAPYLNKHLRTELVENAKVKASFYIQNLLGDTTRIEKLTDNFLEVSLNNSTHLQIKVIDTNTIAVVKSWNYPVSDSDLKIYSSDWHVQKAYKADLALQVEKPDTMQTCTYSELKRLLSPYFITLTLSEKENKITVNYAFPLLEKEKKEQVKAIIKTKTLHWNGKDFL